MQRVEVEVLFRRKGVAAAVVNSNCLFGRGGDPTWKPKAL